ncbi:hypothetical protein CBZ97_007050 [Salmonella enterica]|nr:hypothetical protein [Salmonella enterica]VEA96149.1 fimbrial protein TcfA [Salmonella enterica subsp. houtenae]
MKMNQKNFVIPLLSLFISSLAQTGHASMMVSPMIVEINKEKSVRVEVFSRSDSTDYVHAYVKKIIHPATPDEKEEDAPQWHEQDLLVTPGRLAVPAGSKRVVRLVNLSPPLQEQVYRVYFEPATPGEDTTLNNEKGISSRIGINLVWGVLVHVAPKNPRVGMQLNTEKRSITNNGNQRIVLSDIQVCRSQGKSEACKSHLQTKTIYPGESFLVPDITLEAPGVTRVVLRYYDWIKKSTATESIVIKK